MSVQQILNTLNDFIDETRSYRRDNEDVLREHGAQIKCLATEFKKYEPQLRGALDRRKWWGEFWDRTQKDLMGLGIKAGLIGLLGLIWFALSEKLIRFIKSTIGS